MASSEALPHNSTELQHKVARDSRLARVDALRGLLVSYQATTITGF